MNIINAFGCVGGAGAGSRKHSPYMQSKNKAFASLNIFNANTRLSSFYMHKKKKRIKMNVCPEYLIHL